MSEGISAGGEAGSVIYQQRMTEGPPSQHMMCRECNISPASFRQHARRSNSGRSLPQIIAPLTSSALGTQPVPGTVTGERSVAGQTHPFGPLAEITDVV